MNKSKLYKALVAITGWSALIIQFSLSIEKFTALGWTLAGSIIQIISYFTILTNVLVSFSLTAVLLGPHTILGRFFSRSSVSTWVAINITVVGLVYNLVLRSLWKPQGMDRVVDELLHSVLPLLYLIYWLFFVPKGRTRFHQLLNGLAYPLIYSIYVLIRGALTGLYPYPFMDLVLHGYPLVLLNMFWLCVLFFMISMIFFGLDKGLGRRTDKMAI
jgi:hypothetical protein